MKYEQDKNEEEELDFDEFIKLMSKEMLENMMDEELIEAFKTFGPEDENYGITKANLKKTMDQYGERMNDEEIDALFKESDFDKDGEVGFTDFIRVVMRR